MDPSKAGKKAGDLLNVKGKQHKCLHGRIAAQLDLSDPAENYYFGAISKLMFMDVLEWVISSSPRLKKYIDTKALSKLFKNGGFPKGVSLSVSKILHKVVGGFWIPPGVCFTGELHLFGWQGFLKSQWSKMAGTMIAMMETTPIKMGPFRLQ